MGGGFSKRFAMTYATARCRISAFGRCFGERPRAAFLESLGGRDIVEVEERIGGVTLAKTGYLFG